MHPLDVVTMRTQALHINQLEDTNRRLQQELEKAQQRIVELEAGKGRERPEKAGNTG